MPVAKSEPSPSGSRIAEENARYVVFELFGDMSTAQWIAFIRTLHALLIKGSRRVYIYDASLLTGWGAEQRKVAASNRKELQIAYRQGATGIVYVVKSKLIRGALQATFWLQPPSVQYFLCGTREEAIAWANSRQSEG